jgi:hypothetical protein
MILMRVTGTLIFLLIMVGCTSSAESPGQTATVSGEFVGTTPCDERTREFLGGLNAAAPCHCVTWHLTLITNQQTRLPATYLLVAKYGLPGRNDPNQIEAGPTVKLDGTYEIIRGTASNPEATVCHLYGKGGRSLRLVRLGDHLLHFSASDNRLMTGNAGWSYTLNRKGIGHED